MKTQAKMDCLFAKPQYITFQSQINATGVPGLHLISTQLNSHQASWFEYLNQYPELSADGNEEMRMGGRIWLFLSLSKRDNQASSFQRRQALDATDLARVSVTQSLLSADHRALHAAEEKERQCTIHPQQARHNAYKETPASEGSDRKTGETLTST